MVFLIVFFLVLEKFVLFNFYKIYSYNRVWKYLVVIRLEKVLVVVKEKL